MISVASSEGFDSIVFGEAEPKRWMAGSESFKRTQSFNGPDEATATQEPVQIAITYAEDGTITGFRNGQPYGEPYKKELRHFTAGKWHVLFGLRHEPGGGNRFLTGQVLEARLFDRDLSPGEVAALAGVKSDFVSEADIVSYLEPKGRERRAKLKQDIHDAKERRSAITAGRKRQVYTVNPDTPSVMRVHERGSVKKFR